MSDERQNRDRSVPMVGAEKTRRVDLGLELLCMRAMRGVPLIQDDIAAWCGCTRSAIFLLEKQALKKLANKLRFGVAADIGSELGRGAGGTRVQVDAAEIRALAAAHRPRFPQAAEVKKAAARAWRKSSHGGAPIPERVVASMHADYLRLGSLSKAAALYGRSKADLAYIFHKRGLQVRGRGGPNRRKAA